MPRSGPGPVTGAPSSVTLPRSGAISPAITDISVVLPEPEYPTIATNSPYSRVRSTPPSTPSESDGEANDFSRPRISSIALGDLESPFDPTHQPIEEESKGADGEHAQDDVRVDEAVVLLPQEAADARRSRQHPGGDDHQPRQSERETVAGEHVGQ